MTDGNTVVMALSSLTSSSCSPLKPVSLGQGLSLVPRLRVLLSFTPLDISVKPIDDWQLKECLQAFVKDSLSIAVSDRDLSVHKHKDLHKKRRGEPVASGVLYLWDVQAIKVGLVEKDDEDLQSFLRQKSAFVISKLSGVELSMGGLKLRCQAHLEDIDNFDSLQRPWERHQSEQQGGIAGEFPDTLILSGIPSRWFAEPRVSSKASVLVTHTIFSVFGAIRNLDIIEDDMGSVTQGLDKGIAKAFSCHVWVQFEQHSSFYQAMKSFCGRSMVREGSSFKANYELSWDNQGYFTKANMRIRKFERERLEELRQRQLKMEARQAEITLRQSELAKLEQEKMEREQMEREKLERERMEKERLEREQVEQRLEQERIEREQELEQEQERLREEEERRKEEEDEMLRQQELERMKEEERARKEREHKAEERRREVSLKKEKLKLLETNYRERRSHKEATAKDEHTYQKLAEDVRQGDIHKRVDHSYKQESSKGREISKVSHDQSRTPYDSKSSQDNDPLGRWLLDGDTWTNASINTCNSGIDNVSCSKRLRSIIVDPRIVYKSQ